jgi:EAL domain-containing protein (putative c-di-GMP-specific phosphodiesterase class I)/GGDEF domain-containing protein
VRSRGDTVGIAVITGLTAAIWVLLLRSKAVDLVASRLLAGYWTAAVATLVWCSHGVGPAVAYALFLVPMAVFAALFLGAGAVVLQASAAAMLLWVALVPFLGPVEAALVAVAGCVALSAAPTAVLLLGRSARRHDAVDPDTGLLNGFGLARQVAKADHGSLLVAAVVLDGIGDAREALGYRAGTELLRRAVEDLGQVLPSEAVIGRVDGDEVVVVLAVDGTGPGHPNDRSSGDDTSRGEELPAHEGHALADSLVQAVSAGRYLVGAIEVSLRAHVGLSVAPGDGTDVAELVRRASLSARRAVDRGLPWARWDDDLGALTAEDLALLGDLRMAPERGELTLAYQPQIEPVSGRAVGAEALLRWSSPVRGAVPPGRFIELAERTILIHRLTEWVVAEALDAQVRWRQAGIDLPVSVNLSAKSLPTPGLAAWLLGQLSDRSLPTRCLTVEVTETAVADPVQAASVLQPLRQAGVRISVDDFGTGFTSLAALPTLPLDELKVDQCFVRRCADSVADESIVRTIGELAHRLGLEAVAEGVETREIADHLADMGFDLLQGYYFARPMPEEDLLDLVVQEAPPWIADRSADCGPTAPSRPTIPSRWRSPVLPGA